MNHVASQRHKKNWLCCCFPGPALLQKRDHKFWWTICCLGCTTHLTVFAQTYIFNQSLLLNLLCDSRPPLRRIPLPSVLFPSSFAPHWVFQVQCSIRLYTQCLLTQELDTTNHSPLPVLVVSYFGGTVTFMAGNYFSDTISAVTDIFKNKNAGAPL